MAIRKANPKAAPTPAKAAKADPKAKGKAAPKAEPERKDNRYVRVARVMIDKGDNADIAEIARRSGLEQHAAKRYRDVIVSVFDVLRDAKLMPVGKAAPKKAPVAPKAAPPVAAEQPAEPAAA
jgi:hypothetical protein